MSNTQDYVQWFRGAAPYIKAHRDKTVVIHIPDEVVFSERFTGLTHDLALLNHLGVRLVILHGSRASIDRHIAEHGFESRFHNDIRITDSATLPLVVGAINEVRSHLEAQLSMGLPNTPMSGSNISLVGGNLVIGMPLGVIDGVDLQHTGKVRAVRAEAIRALLADNHVVLLSNLGYSRTGEVFNLHAEELAGKVAQALAADKLIYLGEHGVGESETASTLSTADCAALLDDANTALPLRPLLRHAVQAVQGGVRRVHLIDARVDGGLLLELFTRDGFGTMVTNLFYETIRPAAIEDVGGILSLIEPLESSGVLVVRSREQLELDIAHFQVIDKDGMIIACIACIPDAVRDCAEVACLAVHPDYREAGLGSRLLEIAEQRARAAGKSTLYSLTTRTSHWFIEHGFSETPDFALPDAKRQIHDPARGSKILTRPI